MARGSLLYFCGFLLKWMLCFVYSNIVIVMQTKGYVGVDEGGIKGAEEQQRDDD